MQVDDSKEVDYFALDAAAFLNSPSMQAAIDMLSAHFAAISDEDTASTASTSSPSRSVFSTSHAPDVPLKSGRRARFRSSVASGAYSTSSRSSYYPSDEETSPEKLFKPSYTYQTTSVFQEDLPDATSRGRSTIPRSLPETPRLFSTTHRRQTSNATSSLALSHSTRSSVDYTENSGKRPATVAHRAAAEAYKQSRQERKVQRMQMHKGLQGLLASIAKTQNRALEALEEAKHKEGVEEIGDEETNRIRTWLGKGKEKEGTSLTLQEEVPEPAVLVGEAQFLQEEVNVHSVAAHDAVLKVKSMVRRHRRLRARHIKQQLGEPLKRGRHPFQAHRGRTSVKASNRRTSYDKGDVSALLPIEEVTEDGMSILSTNDSSDASGTTLMSSRSSSNASLQSTESSPVTLASLHAATIEQATRIQVLSNRARQVMGIVDGASGRVTLTRRASVSNLKDLLPRLADTSDRAAVRSVESSSSLDGASTNESSVESDASSTRLPPNLTAAQALLRQTPLPTHESFDDDAILRRAARKYSAIELLFARHPKRPVQEATKRDIILRRASIKPAKQQPAMSEETRMVKHAALLMGHSPLLPYSSRFMHATQICDPLEDDESAIFQRWFQLAQLLSL